MAWEFGFGRGKWNATWNRNKIESQ